MQGNQTQGLQLPKNWMDHLANPGLVLLLQLTAYLLRSSLGGASRTSTWRIVARSAYLRDGVNAVFFRGFLRPIGPISADKVFHFLLQLEIFSSC